MIDTHAHLYDERLRPRLKEVIENANSRGVTRIVETGYDLSSSLFGQALSKEYSQIYFAAGVHPQDAAHAKQWMGEIETICRDEKCVAVGEIGLDYYYGKDDVEIQKTAFRLQIELAHSLALPLSLHIRDAYQDVLNILKDMQSYLRNGILLHCYSGSAELENEFDRFDAYYAFGGAVTFKNARAKREALLRTRKERLLLETDCPYLSPEPYRGQVNEPMRVADTAAAVCGFLGIEYTQLERETEENARRLWRKLK